MPRVSPRCQKTSVFLLQSGTADPPAPPHFDSRSRIFELDSCGGNGKVCLVYKNCTPGVLFLFLQFYFKKYAKPLSAFSPFRNVSSRCRSPAEWSLVPRSLAVLALPDVHVHLLLQTDDHTPRPARVAVRLHPVRAQPSGQGSKAEHSDLRVVNQSVLLKCDSLVHEMFFLELAVSTVLERTLNIAGIQKWKKSAGFIRNYNICLDELST